MIQVSEIKSRVLARLDAEDSERYTFDNDIKPAINGAMEDVITMFNDAFAENKIKPENLRELSKVYVFEPNIYSRVSIDNAVVKKDIWTILAVFPDCKVNKKDASNTNTTEVSKLREDLSFIGGTNASKRLTAEQFTESEGNVFMSGSTAFSGELIQYAHLEATDYSSTTYNFSGAEITVKPSVTKKFVAIGFLMYPTSVTAENNTIPFPRSLTEFFTDLVLNKIAYKQGEAPLLQITEAHINKLASYFR